MLYGNYHKKLLVHGNKSEWLSGVRLPWKLLRFLLNSIKISTLHIVGIGPV